RRTSRSAPAGPGSERLDEASTPAPPKTLRQAAEERSGDPGPAGADRAPTLRVTRRLRLLRPRPEQVPERPEALAGRLRSQGRLGVAPILVLGGIARPARALHHREADAALV